MQTGKVILVGAGPSGLDLLTLKGYNEIQNADVVVFDRLVEQEIIDTIPESTELIDVGKQNNHHPVPQDKINEILVQKAKEGKRVVRLKGGDCFLFGRGGEECEFLLKYDIPFEVVSGVTSAIAAPAYAGIPVTHRDFCSSVHIITAHAKAGSELKIDFDTLVRLDGTLVFLMGLSSIEKIMNGLVASGINECTPVAVIENGTRATQRKVLGTVCDICDLVKANNIKSPAIIVVGKVCTLSQSLDWLSQKPLFGKTIVVTRPKDRIGTLSGKLKNLGANVIEFPCIKTTPQIDKSKLESALKSSYDCVVLTSPAGVHAMVNALYEIGKDLRTLHSCSFAVIGNGTAKELKKYGINADFMPEVYDSNNLGKLLCEQFDSSSNILILRAEKGSDELIKHLKNNNIKYTEVSIYKTEFTCNKSKDLEEMLKSNAVNVVTFTSKSTVEAFVSSVNLVKYSNFTAVCIGEQTAKAALNFGMNVITAENATIEHMVELILREKENV